MSTDSYAALNKRIEKLRNTGNYRKLFPCMSHSEVTAFEAQYEVDLPLAYKLFLQRIGNGIEVNQIIVFPLAEDIPSYYGYQNDFNCLQDEFLYTGRWIRKEYEAFKSWYLTDPEDVKHYVDVNHIRLTYFEANKIELQKQTTLFNIHVFFEGEQFIESLHQEYLFSKKHFGGIIYVASLGCAMQEFLVVNGQCKDTVWESDIANSGSFTPYISSNRTPLKFIDWLEDTMNG